MNGAAVSFIASSRRARTIAVARPRFYPVGEKKGLDMLDVVTTYRNLGIPLFVEPAKDLVVKPGANGDSWYVTCLFKARDKVLGFEWHQGLMPKQRLIPQLSTTEFLLFSSDGATWRAHAASEPVSTTSGASQTECHVQSSFGTLTGDRTRMTLELKAAHGAVSVVLTPQAQELYNGTTGLLPLLGLESYEYAFTNMAAEGSLTIDGETFAFEGVQAWFDRQWFMMNATDEASSAAFSQDFVQVAWTWLGMTYGPGERQAISFWNIQLPTGDYSTFLTMLREDGVQLNALAEVSYDGIVTSPDTGNKYPTRAHITSPQVGLDLHLSALIDHAEFVYKPGAGKSGSQVPCHVTGRIGLVHIDKPVFFEMIGSPGGH